MHAENASTWHEKAMFDALVMACLKFVEYVHQTYVSKKRREFSFGADKSGGYLKSMIGYAQQREAI